MTSNEISILRNLWKANRDLGHLLPNMVPTYQKLMNKFASCYSEDYCGQI